MLRTTEGKQRIIGRRRQGEDFLISSDHGRGPEENDPDLREHSRREEVGSTRRERPSPALDAAISDAIALAERIMQRIDNRWRAAAPPDQSMTSSVGYPWKKANVRQEDTYE